MLKRVRHELAVFRYSPNFKWFVIGLIVMYCGIMSNLVVVNLNSGMPFVGTDHDIVIAASQFSANKVYVPITEDTKLTFLADIIVYGDYAYSIGDLLLGFGWLAVLLNGSVYILMNFRQERHEATQAE